VHGGCRKALLLLSAAACGSVLYIQHATLLPFDARVAASRTFSSGLVPKIMPLAAIDAIVRDQSFQGVVGLEVGVSPAPEGTYAFQLSAWDQSELAAKEGLVEAAQLLTAELQSRAVSEVMNNRKHIDQLRTELAARQTQQHEVGTSVHSTKQETLTVSEGQAALRLRKEIADLKTFLNGGARAHWILGQLDRQALERQRKRTEDAKAELVRQSEYYQPGSKAVQAQTRLVQREKAELLAIEKHLASILLRSHQIELRGLEASNLSRIEQNARAAEFESSESASDESLDPNTESLEWLAKRAAGLEAQGKKLASEAALTPLGEMTVRVENPSGYWLCVALWLGSLVSLLGALTIRPRRSVRPDGNLFREQHVAAAGTVAKVMRPVPEVAVPLRQTREPLESFFEDLLRRMEHELGAPAARLLILGSSSDDERASVSLRLAKCFSDARYRVNLIDFDLQGRNLSRRMGDLESLGIGELLSWGGQTDEFFASVAGTRIQFAPAGNLNCLEDSCCQKTLDRLLDVPKGTVALLDCSFTSPLHVIAPRVDAVLCSTRPGQKWCSQEQDVLLALRKTSLPIWGICRGSPQVFPFL
jgi:hypothetical protein